MNERIRELLEQAGVKYVTMPKDTVYEKFAELIVQECAEYAEHKLDMAGYKKKFMLKHFGVDE